MDFALAVVMSHISWGKAEQSVLRYSTAGVGSSLRLRVRVGLRLTQCKGIPVGLQSCCLVKINIQSKGDAPRQFCCTNVCFLLVLVAFRVNVLF